MSTRLSEEGSERALFSIPGVFAAAWPQGGGRPAVSRGAAFLYGGDATGARFRRNMAIGTWSGGNSPDSARLGRLKPFSTRWRR